ncbi:MAG: DUF3090 family protein [Anaerolineae bacterium]|nr:DUF3090 family protein [Anaerolineae bacterium]MDW8299260.1 DUF3090 family protein [Anaerolineae bacterium]
MSLEIELDPIDFVTIGTVGPKGRRVFYLQAGGQGQVISLIIEKEQARAIAEALRDMLDEISRTLGLSNDMPDMARMNMELREPIEGRFRISRIGLAYSEERDRVLLIAEEMIVLHEGQDPRQASPSVVRLWGTRTQMRALSLHAMDVVKQGRANPAHNGRVLYYWT